MKDCVCHFGNNALVDFVRRASLIALFALSACAVPIPLPPDPESPSEPELSQFDTACASIDPVSNGRVVCADLAAVDQTLVYNRFGSFNPYGMIFTLRRDLAPARGEAEQLTAAQCAAKTGTEEYFEADEKLLAGQVRLKDCKRPRPIVLRVNVGDRLLVRVTNLLRPRRAPDFSSDFCRDQSSPDEGRRRVRIGVLEGDSLQQTHGEADCQQGASQIVAQEQGTEEAHAPDWPATRGVNLVAQGLYALPLPEDETANDVCRGLDSVKPAGEFLCLYEVHQEGTYFFASLAAPAGGEGDGGSIVHGLFGAVLAERQGTRWYRSQVSSGAMDAVWQRSAAPGVNRHARQGAINYEANINGTPILNMARRLGDPSADFDSASHLKLVHADINAIIWCNEALPEGRQDCRVDTDGLSKTTEPGYRAFREFSVFFHDELKTFYTKNFRELGQLGQLAGVKDGFGINYGASGMGSLLLANRKAIGPSADCMECLYEEFFLTSWANGDPALLEWYADDPSNVHHSYLNDPVVFRNFHAGPKETHVFHLHAHQWFAGNDPSRGSYLDSQTVSPQQGFTYNIYHGGLTGLNGEDKGWWDTQGSGNRNRTIGDSIFHCHLYPHFAQGMWALWRVHDVFEDGTRLLPDGQSHAGLSLDFNPRDTTSHKRAGSIDRMTGAWLGATDTVQSGGGEGTPIPALVPLPGEALPLLPTYADNEPSAVGGDRQDAATPMPGYPFYIAGQPGHRPPQAPLDVARDLGPNPGETVAGDKDDREATGEERWLSAGLDRHVVGDGSSRELGIKVPTSIALPGGSGETIPVTELTGERQSLFYSQLIAKAFALGDLSGHLTQANIESLSPWGTPLERAGMGFHFNGRVYEEGGGSGPALKLEQIDGTAIEQQSGRGAYPSLRAPVPAGTLPARPAQFLVNGSPPKPGAPFSDPCGVARDSDGSGAIADPLGRGWLTNNDFLADPMLDGFRRYEVSAVQLDMIVNRAGWHDPQARINVLTAGSDSYKDGPRWRVSPIISDNEEPFFFRALSGECIEFRHTNELPKELELDDFQVKTPTDTVGQHIHLVKFDVTSSDGSGNGWNYEDGTLAPDEVAARLCAWEETGNPKAKTILESLDSAAQAALPAQFPPGESGGFCKRDIVKQHHLWRLPRNKVPFLFQTTVQRWFADPILTNDGEGAVDRTMRTVFTHDHFGPSSIQQHGFYSALVVEPPARLAREEGVVSNPEDRAGWFPRILPPDEGPEGRPLSETDRRASVAWGGKAWAGAHKRIIVAPNPQAAANDPGYFEHPNYREFALAIADFALLYDPRDRETPALEAIQARDADNTGSVDGMVRLYCEAYWRLSPALLGDVCGSPAEKIAGSGYFYPGEVPPAWFAGGANRDDAHRNQYAGDLLASGGGTPSDSEIDSLAKHLVAYRQKAAGTWRPGGNNGNDWQMAKPVAGPVRPESISVDHHDPYLVNYRGAPIPLRVGTKDPAGLSVSDCEPKQMNRPGETGPSAVVDALSVGGFDECSITYQKRDDQGGDLGEAFSSRIHGDPETPILEAYQGERMVLRMIQGAQEVQHSFTIEGQPFKRNIDQHWPQGMQALGLSQAWQNNPTLQSSCLDDAILRQGYPRDYRRWLDTVPKSWAGQGLKEPHWRKFEKLLAECDNVEGFGFAQEIGISEHFEMQGSLRADVRSSAEFAPQPSPQDPPITGDGVPTRSSDYFYSYGSLDALWNGAWGLARIYQNPSAPDPATMAVGTDGQVSAVAAPIGDRLERVTTFAGNESSRGLLETVNNGLACPLASEGKSQRIVDAMIVAVEMRRLFPLQRGTQYGEGLYDPDGLLLALMSPQSLGLNSIEDSVALAEKSADDLLQSIATVYGQQPDPFVLRVKAGDCLRLRLVNLLGEQTGARDRLGDAIMPKITPLNTDPIPSVAQAEGEGGSTVGLLEKPDGLITGVRPSTRLALGFGLPGLDLIRNVPGGFGYNKAALAGGNGGVAYSDVIVAYAGRVRLDLPADTSAADRQLRTLTARHLYRRLLALSDAEITGYALHTLRMQMQDVAAQTSDDDTAALDDAIAEYFGIVSTVNDQVFSSILGKGVTLELSDNSKAPFDTDSVPFRDECGNPGCDDPAAITETLRSLLDSAIRMALNERTHWIPYAFGAVPVRPIADPVSQLPHGLFGAIDVVPSNWQASGDDGLDCDPVADDGTLRCSAGYVSPNGDGSPFTWTAKDASDREVRIREFVLFWRDGMNLWDDKYPLKWQWADSGLPVSGSMVPDCPVCDDSYDRGEAGVSHHAPSFARLLNELLPMTSASFEGPIYRSDDLNAFKFPPDYLKAAKESIRLRAHAGEQVVVRVVHPGGRARQRSFAMNSYSYDDLFPGFGFPRSALLAPGKSISAWLRPSTDVGTAIWHDGPTFQRAAGAWGRLDVVKPDD